MRACLQCDGPVVGRSDKKHCSPECKRLAKREYDRAHHIVNREKKVTVACEWQRANRERKQAYDAEYRERTREHRLQQKRIQSREAWVKYPERMRERAKATEARRRAQAVGSGVFDVTPRDRARALARSGGRCVYCADNLGDRVEWDHVVPISRGGSEGIGNLVPSCRDCNRSKAHRFVSEWRMGKTVPRRGAA